MIVVRSGLHRFLKHADPKLMQLIPEFSALMAEEGEDQHHAIAQVRVMIINSSLFGVLLS